MTLGSSSFDTQEGPLLLTQLSTGMWSVRNLDGERVGYFAVRSDATEALQAAEFRCTERGFFGQVAQPLDGSKWERVG